jgi:murein DD-endopeptidase MepM/ murein hydrolase activator NlpD
MSKKIDANATYKSIFNPVNSSEATSSVKLVPKAAASKTTNSNTNKTAQTPAAKPAILTHDEIRKRNVGILLNMFKERLKEDEANKKSDQELEELCKRIEQEVNNFSNSKQNPQKYKHQMQKIRSNLNDKANDTFYVKLLSGRIRPEDVARMDSPAMASDKEQLKKQMENKKELNAIYEYNQEVNAEKAKNKLLKKTHKGLAELDMDDCREYLDRFDHGNKLKEDEEVRRSKEAEASEVVILNAGMWCSFFFF